MRPLLLALALPVSAGAASIPAAPAGLTNTYDLAERAGQLFGLPPHLMRALVKAESQGNPYALSKAGAMGLTQLMPGTARDLGVRNPWDAWENAWGGAKYLSQQLKTFRRLDLALAAYNAGPGNVQTYSGVPPFAETQAYVVKVARFYQEFLAGAPAPYAPTVAAASRGGESALKPQPLPPLETLITRVPLTPAAAPATQPSAAPVTPAAKSAPTGVKGAATAAPAAAPFALHSTPLSSAASSPFTLHSTPLTGAP